MRKIDFRFALVCLDKCRQAAVDEEREDILNDKAPIADVKKVVVLGDGAKVGMSVEFTDVLTLLWWSKLVVCSREDERLQSNFILRVCGWGVM